MVLVVKKVWLCDKHVFSDTKAWYCWHWGFPPLQYINTNANHNVDDDDDDVIGGGVFDDDDTWMSVCLNLSSSKSGLVSRSS